MRLVLIKPQCREKIKAARLRAVLDSALSDHEYETITTVEEFIDFDFRGKRLLFAISLGESGINLEYYGILKRIRLNRSCFEGCVAGVIVDGNSELYTKSIGRELVFCANLAGCSFPGRPLVEGTQSLENYNIVARNLETDNMGAYLQAAKELVSRVLDFSEGEPHSSDILMLHAGTMHTSNTLELWRMVKDEILTAGNPQITELSLRNGTIHDCGGCSYHTCLHFGESDNCFYGGVITEQVYPSILKCDTLVIACPNYNDAVSANITAFINRMTALFMTHKFYDKRLFALVVSGYSGSDIVAQQLISAINMNKTFILPARFAMLETANNPGSIHNVIGIEERAKTFAHRIVGKQGLCMGKG